MKKSLFVLGVAVAALASCTQNEVVDIAESNVIKFDNAFVGNATKAAAPEVTTETIGVMYVYAKHASSQDGTSAADVFTNTKVYDDGTGTWVYDDLKKWDNETNTYYKFAAYAGKELTNGTQVSFDWTNGLSFTGITIDGAEENQYDLVANGTPVINDQVGNRGLVNFTFSHLLSMVKFTLKNGFDASTPIAISEFKFYGMKTQGGCTYSEGWNWTQSGEAVAVGSTNFSGTAGNATTTAALENSWVVIPQQIANETPVLQFTATVDETPKTFTAKIPAITWQPGYRYNYIFTITAEDMDMQDIYITFGAPKVDEWGTYQDVTGGTITGN